MNENPQTWNSLKPQPLEVTRQTVSSRLYPCDSSYPFLLSNVSAPLCFSYMSLTKLEHVSYPGAGRHS